MQRHENGRAGSKYAEGAGASSGTFGSPHGIGRGRNHFGLYGRAWHDISGPQSGTGGAGCREGIPISANLSKQS